MGLQLCCDSITPSTDTNSTATTLLMDIIPPFQIVWP